MVSLFNIIMTSMFPIISWLGPVIHSPSMVPYDKMRECGFTHTINVYHNFDDIAKDLVNAERNDIKVFVHTPRIIDAPESYIPLLSGKKALAGYFLADEPSFSQIDKLSSLCSRIQKADPHHPCYINLHPYYDDNQLKVVGAQKYSDYVRKASSLNTPVISFDYYSVTRRGLRPTWFQNMTTIRNESIRSGKPFWGFILSVPHSIYDAPTLSTMRLQAYVNLAYGAQGLVYFTFMTPETYGENNFHDAPINARLKPSATYSLVKTMNHELRTVTQLFNGASILKIHHVDSSLFFMENLEAYIRNIISLRASSNEGILVTEMSKNNKLYLLIVNKDYQSDAEIEIVPANQTPKLLDKTLKPHPVPKNLNVSPGDMLILSLN